MAPAVFEERARCMRFVLVNFAIHLVGIRSKNPARAALDEWRRTELPEWLMMKLYRENWRVMYVCIPDSLL